MSAALYRPCVGIALFNRNGEVFVGERIDSPGSWQMPQGGIDEGEPPVEAAFRELREETGTDKAALLALMPGKVRYDIPLAVRERLAGMGRWNMAYSGQEQVWVALRFTGLDSDIDLEAFPPTEFSRWRWVSLDSTPDLIVPFKRDIYLQVVAAFRHLADLGAGAGAHSAP